MTVCSLHTAPYGSTDAANDLIFENLTARDIGRTAYVEACGA